MAAVSNHLILACWITFLVYWLISAWRVKAIAEKQSLGSALGHRIPLGLSYWLLADWRVASLLHWPLLNRLVTPSADWARAAGDLVCLLGLFVTLWARWTLAGNWSSDVTFKHGHELVRTGPYRYVRHPIYSGILMMCLGTALEVGRFRCWLALPAMAFAFCIKLMQEERILRRHFPDAYLAYQAQVKALVPFVI